MAQGFGQYVDTSSSTARVKELKKRIRKANTNDPEELMLIIMEVFKEDAIHPEVNKFYTFVYNAKTPKISYDQHPLIVCTSLYSWGFRGANFHWREHRSYTWAEVVGNLYSIKFNELDELLAIPYKKIINKK